MFALTTAMMNKPIMMRKNVTPERIIPAIIALAIRHRQTYEAIEGILQMLNTIIVGHKFPAKIEGIWKLLSRCDVSTLIRHYYCRKCKTYIAEKTNSL